MCRNSYQKLTEESGLQIESALITEFKNLLSSGNYSSALALVPLVTSNPSEQTKIKYLINRTLFIELMLAN